MFTCGSKQQTDKISMNLKVWFIINSFTFYCLAILLN